MLSNFIIASNPFFSAYLQSDTIGKLIFVVLICLSIISWMILIQKLWLNYQAKKNSNLFQQAFTSLKHTPLSWEGDSSPSIINPFKSLYFVLKRNTLELLSKNKHFNKSESNSYLSPSDIDFVKNHLIITISQQVQLLEKNLFILATIVTLGPFLGLLGTVWGILTTFSEMTGASSHGAVLGGLSLALAATVLGLIDAIPALIGYNYLKNAIRDFETEMDNFAQEILSSVEMQYRKVDLD